MKEKGKKTSKLLANYNLFFYNCHTEVKPNIQFGQKKLCLANFFFFFNLPVTLAGDSKVNFEHCLCGFPVMDVLEMTHIAF